VVVVLTATGLVGLGVPEVLLTVVLALLALASLITGIQRMLEEQVTVPLGHRRAERRVAVDGLAG